MEKFRTAQNAIPSIAARWTPRIVLPFLVIAASLQIAPSIATASPLIKNQFTGQGTLRITLRELPRDGPPRTDQIECIAGSLNGDPSPAPDAKATLTSWTATNCQARPSGYGTSTAKVTMLNLPSVEALDLDTVLLKRPAAGPFKIWVEYRLGEFGNTCFAEVELNTGAYSYSSDGSTNVLYGNPGEFGSFSPEVSPVASGCLRGNVADGALAEIDIHYDFSKPQFQIEDSNALAPSIRITKPPSSSLKTNARLFGRVTPNGATSTYYFNYGLNDKYGSKIPAAGGTINSALTEEHKVSALVGGLEPNTTYHYQLVASNSKGTTPGADQTFTTPAWSTQTTPNASGAYGSILIGVSCQPSSTNMCMAVGGSFPERLVEFNKPLAVRWNGSSWTLTSAPIIPGGATVSYFTDVSCPSSTSCAAVGLYKTASGTFSLIESWNGTSWSIQTSQNPAGGSSTVLHAVSCSSTTACVAVGHAVVGGVKTAIVERWNGSQWSMDTVPVPSGATTTEFRGVDCVSTGSCMAVGMYEDSQSLNRPLSAQWDGSSWVIKAVQEPAGIVNGQLNDVACNGSPMVCTTGGYFTAGVPFVSSSPGQTLIERWNGSAWTLQQAFNPPGDQWNGNVIDAVACTSAEAASCRAAGDWDPQEGAGGPRTLVERWNGNAWVQEPSANVDMGELTQNSGDNYINDIVCRGDTCLAVGTFNPDTWFKNQTMAQISVDDPSAPSFSVSPGSSPTGQSNATFSGVITPNGLVTKYRFEYGLTNSYGTSVPVPEGELKTNLLTPQTVSETVGGLQPGMTYHFRLVATNAEGTTVSSDQSVITPGAWGLKSTPNPAGANASYLYDVSCEPSTSACTAVGKSTISGADSPVAQRWNGTTWSEQAPTKKSGVAHTRLFGVDCPSEARCIAVGNYQGSEGSPSTLAELWNEGKWSIQSTPAPSEATSSELVAVGCSSTASCLGVGSAVVGGVKTAIAARWASPAWSLETIPIPEGAKSSQLDGVDCIWSNFCVAVGRYTTNLGVTKGLAMFWNGSWSLQNLTAPEEATQSALLDVSCTRTPNRCTAVGAWRNLEDGNKQFTLAYRFSGSTWTLQGTPNPSGSVASLFHDVSCATETSCTASGSSVSGGATQTLVESWDGTNWSIQGTPNPVDSGLSSLFGISCQSTTCMGAGWSTNSSGTNTTLAEATEASGQAPTIGTKPASDVVPTKATLKGTVNPNGSETTYQFEYGTTTGYGSKAPASPKSIGSGASPVEVSEEIEGLAPDTTYHFRLVATNAKGTTNGPDQTFTTPSWEILSTPNPSGASDSNLYDVSCEPSTNVCTSVGKSTVSGADSPVAQRWNGTSWSEQSPAKKSGTLPTRLFGVDCPSETRCLAAGNYQPSEGGPVLLTELWNEGKWNVQSPPVPSGATSSELVAIGCNSTAQCRAAGSAVIGGVKTAIVEAWTSPNWTLQTVPIPEGATSSQLDGIDCIWSSVCVAVGRYTSSGGSVKKLAMFWDGTNWSLQTLADPEGAVETTLLDVSCTKSPTRCTAVGGWKNSAGEQFTLAYRYNGSTWTLQSTPNPSGGIANVFQEVSCASETSCTAAGSWVSGGGGSNQTLAETWNGVSWSIQGTPNPPGASFSAFFGVSCQSTTCMGAGWSTNGPGVDTTLAEIRE